MSAPIVNSKWEYAQLQMRPGLIPVWEVVFGADREDLEPAKFKSQVAALNALGDLGFALCGGPDPMDPDRHHFILSRNLTRDCDADSWRVVS